MFIVSSRSNQLCNRLSLYRDLIAAAIELNHQLVIPFFEDYADQFVGTRGDLFCRFPPARSWLKPTAFRRRAFLGLIQRCVRQFRRRPGWARRLGLAMVASDTKSTGSGESSPTDLGSEAFAQLAAGHRLIFLTGPLFRVTSRDWVVTHGDRIRRHFEPVTPIRTAIEAILARHRQGTGLLVGVHIRRGDYATFLDGRWYYSHAQYAAVMRQVSDLHRTESVRFLLASNEAIPLEPFAGLDVSPLTGSDVEDLYTLAGCDLLIGPPSTFGKWAAWHGRVPRYTIREPGRAPEREDFKTFA
jgi:hypothetical protein